MDSSHPNTRTSQGALGQGVAALQIHLCKGIVKSYRTPALHGLAPLPPHLGPKAPQKRLISKVSKPFGQSLPNPWMSQLKGKIIQNEEDIELHSNKIV